MSTTIPGLPEAGSPGIRCGAPAVKGFDLHLVSRMGPWIVALSALIPCLVATASAADLVINEILASNGAISPADEDGDFSDWIEIYNAGDATVNLQGFSLTDDPLLPAKWTFPSVSLGAKKYLLVFASGKDRKPASGNLHANFKLDAEGEYLAFLDNATPRRVLSKFDPKFPEQRRDHSYGRTAGGEYRYYFSPSPRGANSGSVAEGIVADPEFTPQHGVYDEALEVQLSTVTPGAIIRYRMDPENNPVTQTSGAVYSGTPISVAGKRGHAVVSIRAIAYRANYISSNVISSSYIFPEEVLRQPANPEGGFPSKWVNENTSEQIAADYEMDPDVLNDQGYRETGKQALKEVPSLLLVMDIDDLFGSGGLYVNANLDCDPGEGAGCDWEKPCSAELIYPQGHKGFQVNCGIRMQGQSSRHDVWKAPKLSFRLVFRDEYGPTRLRFPLFPDSEVMRFDTIVLDAKLNQVWYHPSSSQTDHAQYVRELFCDDIQNAMGSYAAHNIAVNLYVNGLHWGVYDVHERCDHDFASSYLSDIDAPGTPGVSGEDYDCLKHYTYNVVNPDPPNEARATTAWNAMYSIISSTPVDNNRFGQVQEHLDVEDLCDYIIMNLYAGNTDWAHKNWYATHYTDGGKWRFHSWDAEHVLKVNEVNLSLTSYQKGPLTNVYENLQTNAEFRRIFGDHVHRHFFNGGCLYVNPESPGWDPAHPEGNRPAERYMVRIAEYEKIIVLESARWGDYRRPANPYTKADWLTELDGLLDRYFPYRSGNAINGFKNLRLYPQVGAPVFAQHGGAIRRGFVLDIAKPPGATGNIYCTLDGSDPRVYLTGVIAPTAFEAGSGEPVVLNDSATVKARIREGANWSALVDATFHVLSPMDDLRVTEIMYHPLPEGIIDEDEFEFIELSNLGADTIDLTGAAFVKGILFTFPEGTFLHPDQYLVLVSNEAAFSMRYPACPVAGTYQGRLDNDWDKLVLASDSGKTIRSFHYADGGWWPREADGEGHSLVPKEPAELAGLSDPSYWRASENPGGSPGAYDGTIPPMPPYIRKQPHSVTAKEGQVATFSVLVGGYPPPTYQWQRNGEEIPGATGASYTTVALMPADDGARFRCIASNEHGTVESEEARLMVLEANAPFVRGDSNEDGRTDIADPIHILGVLFLRQPASPCADVMDLDDNGSVNIGDPIFLLQYIFGKGPMPPTPFSACALDPTPDNLRCPTFRPCAK